MAGRPGPQSVQWALFSLTGRIRRATYAWGTALVFVLWWVCLSQLFATAEGSDKHEVWLITLGLVAISSSYCLYALAHKRIHDLGYPGIYALGLIGAGFFLPGFAWVPLAVLAFWPGQKISNAYGPPPVRMD